MTKGKNIKLKIGFCNGVKGTNVCESKRQCEYTEKNMSVMLDPAEYFHN